MVSPAPLSAPMAPGIARPRVARRTLGAAVVAVALLLSALVAAPPAAAATTHRTTQEILIGRAVTHLLNYERAAHSLPALSFDEDLRLAARWHNLAMARYNTLSHQLPGEASFGTRITRAGYQWTYIGENIGWTSVMTQTGVLALQRSMYNETAPNNGHRLNILSRSAHNVGVDVHSDPSGKMWITTDFGS